MSTDPLLDERLDQVFLALSNRTRREILSILRSGEITVNDLVNEGNFHRIDDGKIKKITTQAVVKHLRVLEKAGLISRSIDKQTRPSKLEAEPLREAMDWIEEYREFWNQSFDKLDALMDEIQQKEQK